jgi:hypothetical protein
MSLQYRFDLDGDFSRAYADGGRPSIPPERPLRALLLQTFYTILSERQLMEQTIFFAAGSSGSALTSRCGCRPCSRRIAIDCSKPPWLASSSPS